MNSFTIEDPVSFFKEYKDYKYYSDIDDTTILSLVEARAFKISGGVTLKNSNKISSRLFKFLGNEDFASDIKELELVKLQIEDRTFSILSRSRIMRLNSLVIKECKNIQSKGLVDYFSSKFVVDKLRKVVLKSVAIDDTVLLSLINNSQKIRNLEILTISRCDELSGSALKFLLADNFKKLSSLRLASINISDEALVSLSTSSDLQKLRVLKLKEIKEATSQGVEKFFKRAALSSLEELILVDLFQMNKNVISALTTQKKPLGTLKLKWLSLERESYLELFQSGVISQLKSLCLDNLQNLDDDVLEVLLQNPKIQLLPNSLSLVHNQDLSGKFLLSIFQKQSFRSVKSLSLKECTFLIDLTTNGNLLKKLNLEGIQSLDLSGCSSLVNSFLLSLSTVQSLTNLAELNLSRCSNINDQGIIYLSKSRFLRKLLALYLNEVPITNKSVEELVKSEITKTMEKLHLESCSQLNDEIFDYLIESNTLRNLKEINLSGCTITSEGVDKLVLSEKMRNIERLLLTNGCLAFPAFYQSSTCSSLLYISGSFDEVSSEDVRLLMQSQYLSPEFSFDKIMAKVAIDDSILVALGKSKFLKKIWTLNITDMTNITPEGLISLISSENLNPFFNIDALVKSIKAILNDDILTAMARNPLCVNNLYELDVVGCNKLSEKGIIEILKSKFLCTNFRFNEMLQSIRYRFWEKPKGFLTVSLNANYTQNIKALNLSEYHVDDSLLENLLISPSPFLRLKHLNLDDTKITETSLYGLADSEIVSKLTSITMNDLKKISKVHWEEFFRKISSKKEIILTIIEVEFTQVSNTCLESLSNASWIRRLKKIGLSGVKYIDEKGLQILFSIKKEHKTLELKDVYEDFKQFLIQKDDGSYEISAESNIDLDEVIDTIEKSWGVEAEFTLKKEIKRKKTQIRNNSIRALVEDPRVRRFSRLDLSFCSISSEALSFIAVSSNLTSLQEINFDETNIDSFGLANLKNANLPNLKRLTMKNCYMVDISGIETLLECNFSPQFNPDCLITEFAGELTSITLTKLSSCSYFQNLKELNLSSSNDLDLNDLKEVLNMQVNNKGLEVKMNFHQILNQYKSDLNDDMITLISQTRLIQNTRSLDLSGADISKQGLVDLILSPFIHRNFIFQPIIDSFATKIDDDVLSALSRSRFFRNMKEISLRNCPSVTSIGLLNVARNSNPEFNIQALIDEFADLIDKNFIKIVSQQEYFDGLTLLNISKCLKLKSDSLIQILQTCGEKFDIESFIEIENLPGGKAHLVNNDVMKAISESKPFKKIFIEDNKPHPNRKYFGFNIRKFREVDYGINYLIEEDVAPHNDYDDYIQHYLSYLTFESLCTVVRLCVEGQQSILEQLSHVARLDFSQNKHIYNISFVSKIKEALDTWQNNYHLNMYNQTLDQFSSIIMNYDISNSPQYQEEDEKDLKIIELLQFLPSLEELNLNNQNIGDLFLKRLSYIIVNPDEKKRLNNLKFLKLKNNSRFTSVGLKYLYCSLISRKEIEQIDVGFKGNSESAITYFVNNGLYGFVDYYVVRGGKTLLAYLKRNKIRIICDIKSLILLSGFALASPLVIFHLFEKFMDILMTKLSNISEKFSWRPCYDCLTRKRKTSGNQTQYMKTLTASKQKIILPESSDDKDNPLLLRYQKIESAIRSAFPREKFKAIKKMSKFYFDESFYSLNYLLSGGSLDNKVKPKAVSDIEERVPVFEENPEQLIKNSFFLGKLRWFMLFNIFSYFVISIGYQIFYYTTNMDQRNRTLLDQTKYYIIYAVLAFLFELGAVYEIARIVNNKEIINVSIFFILFDILGSQLAKYDMFTDISYVLDNIFHGNCEDYKGCDDRMVQLDQKRNIWIPSLVFLLLTIFLFVRHSFGELWKCFFKKKKNRHPSYYINLYSKLCFNMELQALGNTLDQFSTSSAEKFTYWFLPRFLYNVYIPLIIVITFQRLFVQDIPQIIIQTVALITEEGVDFSNLSILLAFLSSIFNLLMTLHTAWRVKPSLFNREIFKIYRDVVYEEYRTNKEGDIFSATESQIGDHLSATDVADLSSIGNIHDFELNKKDSTHDAPMFPQGEPLFENEGEFQAPNFLLFEKAK